MNDLQRRVPVRVTLTVLGVALLLINAVAAHQGEALLSDREIEDALWLIGAAIGCDTVRPSGKSTGMVEAITRAIFPKAAAAPVEAGPVDAVPGGAMLPPRPPQAAATAVSAPTPEFDGSAEYQAGYAAAMRAVQLAAGPPVGVREPPIPAPRPTPPRS